MQTLIRFYTALRWINKYIGYFGGDSNSVTVAGQSAGGLLNNFLIYTTEMNNLVTHKKNSQKLQKYF